MENHIIKFYESNAWPSCFFMMTFPPVLGRVFDSGGSIPYQHNPKDHAYLNSSANLHAFNLDFDQLSLYDEMSLPIDKRFFYNYAT